MTRDYARQPKRATPARNTRRQPSRKTLPGWLWMVAGVLIGALVMAVINHKPAPARQETAETAPTEPETAPETAPGTEAPRPRFDFYTLLKESEVILNDDGTPQPGTVTTPAPTLPPPSQPRDDDKIAQSPTLSMESKPSVAHQPIVTAPIETTPATPPAPPPAAEPSSKPQPQPSSQAAASRDIFLLQAGSFKSAADADNLRARLLLLNMQARVETVNLRPGETWHRVQVGPFDNTQSLANARNLLQQNGITSIQVKKTQ